MAGCMHPPGVVPEQRIVYMRRLLIVGFSLAVLTATCAAQDKQHPIKHYQDKSKSEKSVAIGKTPSSQTPEANLRRLEQQSTKVSAPKAKRTPGSAGLVKTNKERPNPPINFSGGSGGKGSGTTAQGKNPYHGRLRKSHH